MLKAILAAIVISFFASSIAVAQTAPAQTGDQAKPQASPRKVAPHDHARDAKQGAAASRTAEKKDAKKKPLHDHRKEHKQ